MDISNDDIFRVMDSLVPDNWKTRYQVKRNTKLVNGDLEIIPNTITIKIKPYSKPVRCIDGSYRTHFRRIIFNVYSNRGTYDVIKEGESVCEFIRDKLTELNNRSVTIKTETGEDKRVWISDCQILIDVTYLGVTEEGIHIHSMEYVVVY